MGMREVTGDGREQEGTRLLDARVYDRRLCRNTKYCRRTENENICNLVAGNHTTVGIISIFYLAFAVAIVKPPGKGK